MNRVMLHERERLRRVKQKDQKMGSQRRNYSIDELIDMGRKQDRMEIAKDITMNKNQNGKRAFN